MAAYEIPSCKYTGVAEEAITRRRFLKVGTADGKVKMADSAEVVIGVSMNDSAINEVTEIAGSGLVLVEAGELLAIGTEVQAGADGVAVTYASGNKVGVTITAAGASGELCTVKLYN